MGEVWNPLQMIRCKVGTRRVIRTTVSTRPLLRYFPLLKCERALSLAGRPGEMGRRLESFGRAPLKTREDPLYTSYLAFIISIVDSGANFSILLEDSSSFVLQLTRHPEFYA
jgi:hypothetical protein